MKYTVTLVTLLVIATQVMYFCSLTTVSASGIASIECYDQHWKKSSCIDHNRISILGTNFEKLPLSASKVIISEEENITVSDWEAIFSNTNFSGYLFYNNSSVANGAHKINITSNLSDKSVFYATLMLGTFYGITVPNYLTKPPLDDYNVTGQAYDTITEGCNFTVNGIFDTNSKYEVLFYATDASVPIANIPTCGEVTVIKNTLTCEVTKAVVSSKYTFSFIVRDAINGVYLHNMKVLNSVSAVEFSESCAPYPSPDLPTLPYVTDATGECVSKSSKCTNGATLTFTGGAFDKDKMNKQIDIQGMKGAACAISDVSTTSLTCKLSGIDKDAKGTFPMTLQTSMTYQKTKNANIYMGALVLGEGNAHGYTLDYDPSEYTSNTFTKSSHLKKVTTALTVVFAILFGLALASLIFMSCKYKMIPRKVWSSITSQLTASNNNNNFSSRPNDNDNMVEGDVNEPVRNY